MRIFINSNKINKNGDWGLGIWAQSPIPNPQSPIPIQDYEVILPK